MVLPLLKSVFPLASSYYNVFFRMLIYEINFYVFIQNLICTKMLSVSCICYLLPTQM